MVRQGDTLIPRAPWKQFSFKPGTQKFAYPLAGWRQAKQGRLCPDAGAKEFTLLLIRELVENIQLYCFKLDVNAWRKLFPFHEVFDYLMEGNSKQDRNISLFCFKSKLLAWLGFQNPK